MSFDAIVAPWYVAPMRDWSFAALALMLSFGCYTETLTEAGKAVQVMESDPPAGCREVGSVAGRGDAEQIKINLRNAAASKGGNYVRLETFDVANETTTGTAFRCADAN